MVYSLYIHDKHNQDWSNSSYENVFDFNNSNETNIKKLIDNFENCNIIDYDVYITKNHIIPNNENNYGTFKVEISIVDKQKRVIEIFKNLFNFLIKNNFTIINKNNNFKYDFRFIGIILKDDLCCIRLNLKKCDEYIKKIIISNGKLNENDKIYSFLIKNDNQNKRSERYKYETYKKRFH